MKKELKQIHDDILIFFNIDTVDSLGNKLLESLFSKKKNEIIKQYCDIVEDTTIDWLQKIFQYYKADRQKGKSQDYTPPSLAKCLSKLTYHSGANTVLDVCSGSGSLVLQMAKQDRNLKFTCLEFDENVIPFLLFNLCMNNLDAIVCRYDVIENKKYKTYKLTKNTTFSDIEEIEEFELGEYDVVISNPPFNLSINSVIENKEYNIKAQKDGDSYFVLFCLNHCKSSGKIGIILHTSYALRTTNEVIELRKNLVENNLLESIICNPANMFESTNIQTITIVLSKHNKNNYLPMVADLSNHFSEYIRYQNGQVGGNSHTKRTYKKKFNYLSDEDIDNLYNYLKERVNKTWIHPLDYSKAVNNMFIIDLKEYTPLKPSKNDGFVILYKELCDDWYLSYMANFFNVNINTMMQVKEICKQEMLEPFSYCEEWQWSSYHAAQIILDDIYKQYQ